MADEEKKLNGVDEHDDRPDKKTELKEIDADSIIDLFLKENTDLADLPVEEWPEDAIEMLKETFNTEHVDAPNGVLPEEEDESGEPLKTDEPLSGATTEEVEPEIKEPTTDVENPEQDFDIAELAKLVEAGDKDGAWSMLQNMFGITAEETPPPTNQLDRLVGTSNNSNALAKLIGGLKF